MTVMPVFLGCLSLSVSVSLKLLFLRAVSVEAVSVMTVMPVFLDCLSLCLAEAPFLEVCFCRSCECYDSYACVPGLSLSLSLAETPFLEGCFCRSCAVVATPMFMVSLSLKFHFLRAVSIVF